MSPTRQPLAISENTIQLSLLERFGILIAIGKTFFVVLLGIITKPWSNPQQGPSLKSYIGRRASRTLLSSLSLRQQKYVIPDSSGEKEYMSFCKKWKAEPIIENFPKGAKAYWIGDPSSEDIIVYIPGGGYALPTTGGHFEICRRLYEEAKQQTRSQVAVIVVTYSLTPQAKYPLPVEQTIWAVKTLLEERGKDPSKMIIAGDSAGGTLALNIVSHATHPFPSLPPYESKINVKFRGLLLLSPWADFRNDQYGSFQAKAASDVITPETLNSWSGVYLGSSTSDVWTTPCLAEPSWWQDFSAENILLTAGEEECMRDMVIGLGDTLQASSLNVETEIGTDECHVDSIASINFDETGKDCETATAIKKWVVARTRLA